MRRAHGEFTGRNHAFTAALRGACTLIVLIVAALAAAPGANAAFACTASATTKVWVASAPAAGWATAANWLPAGSTAPTATSLVCIPTNAATPPTIPASTTLAGLRSERAWSFAATGLVVNGPLEAGAGGSMSITGGSVSGVTTTETAAGSTITIAAATSFSPASAWNVSGAGITQWGGGGGPLGAGSVSIFSGSQLSLLGGTTHNFGSRSISINGSLVVDDATTVSTSSTVTTTASGALRMGTLAGGNATVSASITNNGLLENTSSTADLTFTGNVSSSTGGGTFRSANAGRTLRFTSGTTTLTGTPTFSGGGAVAFDSGSTLAIGTATPVVSGTLRLVGTAALTGTGSLGGTGTLDLATSTNPAALGTTGTLSIYCSVVQGATASLSTDRVIAIGGTWTIPSGGTISPSTLGLGQLHLEGDGALRATSGTAIVNVPVANGGALQATGAGTVLRITGTNLLNAATASLEGGTYTASNGGRIEHGGTATTAINGVVQLTGAGSTFGLVAPAGTSALATLDTISVDGTLQVLGGATLGVPSTLSVNGRVTLGTGSTLTVPGELSIGSGTLAGSGTITGSVSNSTGTLRPSSTGGTLAITGNLTQLAGGTLAVDAPAHTSPAGPAAITVGGTVDLAGSMTINSAAFVPNSGDWNNGFVVVDGAGAYANTISPTTFQATTQLLWTAVNDGLNATLSLVPSDSGAPSAVPSGSSSTHSSVGTVANAISVSFGAANDGSGSGIAGYDVAFSAFANPASEPLLDGIPDIVPPDPLSITSTALVPGTWYFHVRAIDNQQNRGAVFTVGPLVILPPPPTAGVLITNAWGTSFTQLETTNSAITWSASTDTSVTGYDVLSRYQNAKFVMPTVMLKRTTINDPATRRWATSLLYGYTYCFRVDAFNAGGQRKVGTQRCTSIPYDDRATTTSALTDWKNGTGLVSQNYRGSYRSTTKAGAFLKLALVRPRRIQITAMTCSSCGSFKLMQSGVVVHTFNTFSSTTKYKQPFVYTFATQQPAGDLKIVAVNAGKTVRIDSIGISLT